MVQFEITLSLAVNVVLVIAALVVTYMLVSNCLRAVLFESKRLFAATATASRGGATIGDGDYESRRSSGAGGGSAKSRRY